MRCVIFDLDGTLADTAGDLIAAANAAFAPDEKELAAARDIIAGFDEAMAQGKGVVVVNGRLVENLHVEEAKRQLALADAIAHMG